MTPWSAAENPLDDDAGSGGDAGDSAENATPITPGRHEGRLTPVVDETDYYQFEAGVGDGIAITRLYMSSLTWMRLTDPDGNERSIYYALRFISPVNGTYTLQYGLTASVPAGYSFILDVADVSPQNDGDSGRDAGETADTAVPLVVGTSTGQLESRFDDADWYAIELAQGESLHVELPEEYVAQMRVVKGWTLARSDTTSDGGEALSIVARDDGTYHLVVEKGWGTSGGNYTLLTDVAASQLHDLVPVAVGLPGPRALFSGPAGVFVGDYEGVKLVDESGIKKTVRLERGVYDGTQDAEGRPFVRSWDAMTRVVEDDDVTPFARTGRDVAFGPDGDLYGLSYTTLVRTTCDREVTTLRLDRGLSGLAFSADGTLYGHSLRGSVYRIDTNTGSTELAFKVPGRFMRALAFDAEGNAYAANTDGDVLRFDGASGPATLIAMTGGNDMELAFSGSRLFMSSTGRDYGSPISDGVGYIQTSVQGFTGFHPTCVLPPLPDLVVSDITETRRGIQTDVVDAPNVVNEKRAVTVTVTNEGEGPSLPATNVQLWRDCGPLCLDMSVGQAHIPPLAPGESVQVTIQWDTTLATGDQTLRAVVDWRDGVLEENEANNMLTKETWVRVGGVGRIT